MVNPRRQNNQIVLGQLDAHPLVLDTADIKVPLPVEDVPDLLVLVEVLGEEGLDLVLVRGAQGLRGHDDLVAVLVAALPGELVDLGDGGEVAVEDAQGGQVVLGDGAAGVVGVALVALWFGGLVSFFCDRILICAVS